MPRTQEKCLQLQGRADVRGEAARKLPCPTQEVKDLRGTDMREKPGEDIPPIRMIEVFCRSVLTQNEQIAQSHLQESNPCCAFLMRAFPKCLCARPYVLDTLFRKPCEKFDGIVPQRQPLCDRRAQGCRPQALQSPLRSPRRAP